MSEERMLRLNYIPDDTVEIKVMYQNGDGVWWNTTIFEVEDLEHAPRSEKEIRAEIAAIYGDEFVSNDCDFAAIEELLWAFPYLSEEKKETKDE